MSKGPKWVRVDDRLIHGEVVVAWLSTLGTSKIVVVDDGVAKDEFMREVLHLAAPTHSTLIVLSLDQALSGDWLQFDDALVLVKSPLTALALRQGGVEFTRLNVGGLGARPGRTPLYKNISASPEEIEAMKEFEQGGGEVIFQIVPTDGAVPLSKVQRR
jgi:PTS system mannose-specific IIB component